ncbi:MAG: prephenate dehydrogenase/arogenate dehydrogenase family protein, partial [Thiotrichales bacterium]|nr:prephenate dehydrogenase/arogenate dehydrogenase family protein [Thiotrichales bacterium]
MIQRLAILGVGLIGGSLALSLKQKGLVGEVVGFGRSHSNLQEALNLGIIDRATNSAAEAVKDADMVVMAVPLASMRSLLEEIKYALAPNAVLTDVGSAKGCWVNDVLAVWEGQFPAFAVPAHPIAGAERSGAAAALADLYVQRKVVITPHQDSASAAIERVTQMWQATGADVRHMTVAEHDATFAWTSHLPHLLSFALVDMFSQREDVARLFDYTAGGFRDFTRIAASDPTMWRDIVQLNAPAIAEALAAYQA